MSILEFVAFLWTMVGILPGIVFLILGLLNKDATQKAKLFKWAKICFGGLALLLIIFILYALLGLLGALLGISLITTPDMLPK